MQYSEGGHVVNYKFVGNNSCMANNIGGMEGKAPFKELNDAVRLVNLKLPESSRNSVV